MRCNFFITGLTSSAVGPVSALAITYSAGRWGHVFTPEFFTARLVGIFAGIIVCNLLLRKNAERRRSGILGAYCVVIGLYILFLEKSSDLLHKFYFAGFEQAVFSAGTEQQWESLVSFIIGSYEKGIDWRNKPLPNFVQSVYPGHDANISLMSMTPGTNDYIALDWRGVSFDRILMIGHIRPEEFDSSNGTCCKQYSDTILFKITGNE